jgi:hypothetical protein
MVLRLQSLQPTRRGYCETLLIQATQVLAFSYNACVQPRHTQTCRSEKGDVAQRARGCAAARESRIRRIRGLRNTLPQIRCYTQQQLCNTAILEHKI